MNSYSKDKSEPTKNSLRRGREREEHRSLILREAEQVFGRHGYHGTTIEEIAKRAGFSVGTLYNFFKNKDDLYTSILVSHHEEISRRFDAILAEKKNLAQTLPALLKLILSHFNSHRAFVQIFFASSPGPIGMMNGMPAAIRRFHDHYTESTYGLFKRAAEAGELRDLDPRFLTFCYEGFISGIIRYWAETGFQEPLASVSAKAEAAFKTLLGNQGKRSHVS